MMHQVERAVQNIFSDYEDTPALREFKEEIAVNMNERIQDMIQGGLTQDQALDRALQELGDITEAADNLSRQKRQEAIGSAYARAVPLDRRHALGYPLAGAVLLLGLLLGALATQVSGVPLRALATGAPLVVLPVAALVYLGLTQETRTHYPMGGRRGLCYALCAVLLQTGLLGGLLTLLAGTGSRVASLTAVTVLALPALALLAWLVLTERSRKKPWVQRMEEEQSQRYDEHFGLLSDALWLAALGLLLLLGMLVGWRFAWPVLLFATAGQCVLQAHVLRKQQ